MYFSVDGVDYVSVNTTLNAFNGSTCVNIIITDNDKLHVIPSKSFYLELMLVMGEIDQQIDIHPNISRVAIYDNESEFLFYLYTGYIRESVDSLCRDETDAPMA